MENQGRYNVERSCLRCHERKIRCDKKSPCGRCVRQNVACQYPGPSRVKRQPPKKSTTDMAARLEQLERSIAALVREQPSQANTLPTSQHPSDNSHNTKYIGALATPSTGSPATSTGRPEFQGFPDFLGKDGRYINEPLLTRVLEKEQELRSAIGSPSDTSSPQRGPIIKAEGLLTNPLLMQLELKELYPSRWQATVLWQTFLSRVDPLVKVIHVPSVQSQIFAAINRPESVRADVRSLLFAIYFAATTTLLSDDIHNEATIADLRKFKQGFEISLYHAEFLDAPTITSLQAMIIYQTCYRYSNSGRSGWTMHGLTIRAAQSIGLQRDGKHFKLPELECELRRRLWWHIHAADSRVTEDHGLSVPENNIGDTDFPLNIDDQSLSESAATHVSQARWTEMTFSLIIMETNTRRQEILSNLNEFSDGDQILAEFRTSIEEKYLRHSDPDIPIQRFGFLLGQLLLFKTEICARQKLIYLRGKQPSSLDYDVSQKTLLIACTALETGLEMHSDELLRGFRWLTTTYTQYHLLTYILWHMCVYPEGLHDERAWRGVNIQFAMMEDPSWPDPGPKWPIVVQLKNKAQQARQARDSAQGQSIIHETAAAEPAPIYTFDIDGWDPDCVDISDWNSLAQSLSLLR
ncbi:unnamed protein product [Penicillium olsonii]|uniref:Zn(2)-C6 fungal-type domain-containing protein n=1 Tax=Penicillium olsonii TaxID=99116 RepID=A0A9W4HR93_PENOL|nr:unnamed protein product [Penicillium olsonii]CAG8095215.1 unnamed protein product [Penicillium olsonii]